MVKKSVFLLLLVLFFVACKDPFGKEPEFGKLEEGQVHPFAYSVWETHPIDGLGKYSVTRVEFNEKGEYHSDEKLHILAGGTAPEGYYPAHCDAKISVDGQYYSNTKTTVTAVGFTVVSRTIVNGVFDLKSGVGVAYHDTKGLEGAGAPIATYSGGVEIKLVESNKDKRVKRQAELNKQFGTNWKILY